MDQENSQAPTPITRRKRVVFSLAIAVIMLLLLEVGARVFEGIGATVKSDANPFVDATNPAKAFMKSTVDGREVYVASGNHPYMAPNDPFAYAKPANGLRVFMVGGSAAAGWPHDVGGAAIINQLGRMLEMLYPDRTIEAINAACGTYASHRAKFIFDEVIEYQPDLIVIYSGNNEFLESFVFRSNELGSPWRHLAIARAIHKGLGALSQSQEKPKYDVKNYSFADQFTNRVSYAFGKSSRFREDPEQFRYVLDHYRYNIETMVETCKERGVPVVLTTVPVNLKDWVPNASIHQSGLAPKALERWQTKYREGYLAVESAKTSDDFGAAVAPLREAIDADSEHAETHYWLGKALHGTGDNQAAKEAFIRALERDAHPFRALPQFQEILFDVAKSRDVPIVDITTALEGYTADGTLGLDMLVDYVHLTAESQEIVAHEILMRLAEIGWFPEETAIPVELARVEVSDVFGDERDMRVHISLLMQYLVMRQYDQLDLIRTKYVSVLNRILRTSGGRNPELARQCRQGLQTSDRIHRVIRKYRKLLRAEKLGIVADEFTPDEAQAIYKEYVTMIHELEAPRMSWEEFLELVPDLEYEESGTD